MGRGGYLSSNPRKGFFLKVDKTVRPIRLTHRFVGKNAHSQIRSNTASGRSNPPEKIWRRLNRPFRSSPDLSLPQQMTCKLGPW